MPSNIEELYQAVIMDHAKNPLNKGLIHNSKYKSIHFNNPSCGDDITIEILIENGIIKDIRHEGHGCSISMSSASVVSEQLKGMKVEKALEVINDFYEIVKGNKPNDVKHLGDAIAYNGVSKFPARIKCATLAWKACEQAIKEE